MNTSKLTTYLQAAIEAAKQGAAQLEQWRTKFVVREKERANLVTDADNASQAVIKKLLLDEFPESIFLGEEDCFGKSIDEIRPTTNAPTWIVDPLDGTSNYVHDVPHYCVSIGLLIDQKPVVGVIYDPRLNEMFSAAQGHGAFLNGQPMRVSTNATLEQSLISSGFPSKYELHMRNWHIWRKVAYHAQTLRRTGSTALNLAYIACGRMDGYWCLDNWPWDTVGGVVLIEEAGGQASTADGLPFDPFRMDICASNAQIQAELLRILRDPLPPEAETLAQ